MPILNLCRFTMFATFAICFLSLNGSATAQQLIDPSIKTVKFEGVVEPLRAADISPRFDGVIQTYTFQVGDFVKKGDLLVQLLTLEQEYLLKIDRANLDRAEAQVGLAEAKLERAQILGKKKVISAAELDAAEAERDVAAASRNVAKTQFEMRQIMISQFSLYAPFDGMVSAPYVNEGAYITKQAREVSALATVTQLNPIKVTGMVSFDVFAARRAYLPNDEAAKAGVTLSLILPNGDRYPHTGKIVAGGQQFDKESQRIPVSAIFPNPDLLLRPGLKVEVVSTLK